MIQADPSSGKFPTPVNLSPINLYVSGDQQIGTANVNIGDTYAYVDSSGNPKIQIVGADINGNPSISYATMMENTTSISDSNISSSAAISQSKIYGLTTALANLNNNAQNIVAWVSGTAYLKGALVHYQGVAYKNLTGINTATNPSADFTNWMATTPPVDTGINILPNTLLTTNASGFLETPYIYSYYISNGSNMDILGNINFSTTGNGTTTVTHASSFASNTVTLPTTSGSLVSTGDSGTVSKTMVGQSVWQSFMQQALMYPTSGYDNYSRLNVVGNKTLTNQQLCLTFFTPMYNVSGISRIRMVCGTGNTDTGGTTIRRMGLFQITAGAGTNNISVQALGVTSNDPYLFTSNSLSTSPNPTNVNITSGSGTTTSTWTCASSATLFTVGQWVQIRTLGNLIIEGTVTSVTGSPMTGFTLNTVQNAPASVVSASTTANTYDTYGMYDRPLWTANSTGNTTTYASINLTAGTTYATGVFVYNTGGTYGAPGLSNVKNIAEGANNLPLIVGSPSTAVTNITNATVTSVTANTTAGTWARIY